MAHSHYILLAYAATFVPLVIVLIAFTQQHFKSSRKLRDLLPPADSHEAQN